MQEIDLLVACFNPTVAPIVNTNIEYMKNKYFGQPNFEKLLDLVVEKYELIVDGGFTENVFGSELIRLGYDQNMTSFLLQSFQKMQKYTEAELHSIKTALSNVITNEAINKCKRENITSPVDFVKALKEFNVDNIQDVDKRIYRESKFTEIDIDKLKNEIVGNSLKSSLKLLNSCSPLGGYVDRTLTMVSGKPGCFFGNTPVRLCTGEIKSLQDLYEEGATNIPVYSMNTETGGIIETTADACVLTKEITEYMFVGLRDDVHRYIFDLKCTPEHPFLTICEETSDFIYTEAKNLKSGDKVVMGNYVNGVMHTCVVGCTSIKKSEKPIPVFDLVNAGPYHNFAIHGCYDWGIFVHNSGKSLFMIQEACAFCKQGKKVLYLALGDMNEFHFVTRIIAQQMNVSLSRASVNFDTYYQSLISNPEYAWLSNLLIQYFTPDQISCANWISFIKSRGYYDEYDVFIADYDSNFASDQEMYQKGETTYNQLKFMSDRPGKWVFVACQPKPAYFSEEILPLESGNESSRKQQIVDNMITISYPPTQYGVNHIGIINVPKYRGGMTGSTPYLMDKNGRFEEITVEMYNYLKIAKDSVTLPNSGCTDVGKTMSMEEVPEIEVKGGRKK